MEPIERRLLECGEPIGNETTQARKRCPQSSGQSHAETVSDEMPAAEALRVANEVGHAQPDGRVICRDNRACAGSDNDVDGDAVIDELLKHAHVTCATQPAAAQNKSDANWRASGRRFAGGSRGMIYKAKDKHPHFEVVDTDYGVK